MINRFGNGRLATTMQLNARSWKQFFYYGEVVGFLMAWLVGVAVLSKPQSHQPRMPGVESLASSAELPGPDRGAQGLK